MLEVVIDKPKGHDVYDVATRASVKAVEGGVLAVHTGKGRKILFAAGSWIRAEVREKGRV